MMLECGWPFVRRPKKKTLTLFALIYIESLLSCENQLIAKHYNKFESGEVTTATCQQLFGLFKFVELPHPVQNHLHNHAGGTSHYPTRLANAASFAPHAKHLPTKGLGKNGSRNIR